MNVSYNTAPQLDTLSVSDISRKKSANIDPRQLQGDLIQGELKLQIWDTAGEERFRALTPMYYKNAEGIIIAFSLTSAESFENLGKWMSEIEQNASISNCVKIIVGTKCDLDADKEVSYKDASKFAKSHNALYFETSAKSGFQIQEAFSSVANEVFRISQTAGFNENDDDKADRSKKIKLDDKKSRRKKKKKGKKAGCC